MELIDASAVVASLRAALNLMGRLYFVTQSYTFFFIIFTSLLFRTISTDSNSLTAVDSLTVLSNRTIVSSGGIFEFGFFRMVSNSRNGDRWYIGIWYKTIPERTYVWVANRDRPLSSSNGTLRIFETNIVLLDQSDSIIWSTNLSRAVTSPVVATLLSNGNLVLRDTETKDPDTFLWQSFDFPTDTLLPYMKLGWDLKTGHNRYLTSWRNLQDPSSGSLSFKLETQGLPDFYLWKIDARGYRSGPWDGIQFSGIPEMQRWNFIVNNFTETREEITYTYRITDRNRYSRLVLSPSGLQQFAWNPTGQEWTSFWDSSQDDCVYDKCGPYSYCDTNTSPMCNCISGFRPMFPEAWALGSASRGCVREMRLSCSGDRFIELDNMKIPDTMKAVVDRRIGLKQCQERCMRDCNCTAFTNIDIRNGGSGCLMWKGEFEDTWKFVDGGQKLYVRLAAVALAKKENKISGTIIGVIVGISILLLLIVIACCVYKIKQKQSRQHATTTALTSRIELSGDNVTEDFELPLMEFEAIVAATDNFSDSNKLGKGGFGTVYKGVLQDGEEIAVKKLSEMSRQGISEFENEVRLIAKLQHINLVRLLGWCVNGDEKMLIYEYLQNLSLDFYLFGNTPSSKLSWQMRLEITNGIARGLLYLHQDSRFRIIHRDLKAANILLDKDMIPKISDFGMARIFGRNVMESTTTRVVGTYGYMSPEYAMDGIFSVKSDVFSFGVLVLEIVSGKRNRFYDNHDTNLLGYAWRNWREGNWLEIVDPFIVEQSASSLSAIQTQEILRCIQISLLCVQERAEDRPTMASVVMMLGSETFPIPQPKRPAYCAPRSLTEIGSSSSNQPNEQSVNQITLTGVQGR